MLDTPTRTKIDLSGTWNYAVEGGPSGQVGVPSSYDFVGKVTFDRKFTITPDQLDSCGFYLVMYGVNYDAEISINGEFVGSHVGGYTSFVRSIPGTALQPGSENVIIVTVSNLLTPDRTLPTRTGSWGWRNYGGIVRDVFLLGVPKLSIRKVMATARLSESMTTAEVSVRASIESSRSIVDSLRELSRKGTRLVFSCELVDKISGTTVARSKDIPVQESSGQWQDMAVSFPVSGPKLWTPETPDLYLLRCKLGTVASREFSLIDEYDMNCGVRNFDIRDANLLLNNRRIVLRGVVWVEDHPTWGSSLTYEEMEKDVVLIKNLGANAVRFMYHPPHPYMLNLCDRYGLVALEEIPVVRVPAEILTRDPFLDLATTSANEMISRDIQHPSILAWGIGDEFESSQADARKFVDAVSAEMRSLDSRPVYYTTRTPMHDSCTSLVDFVLLDPGSGDTKDFKAELQRWSALHPSMPSIVGQVGTEVQDGNRNGYSDPLSYDAQSKFFLTRLEAVTGLNYDGVFALSFNDWKGDRPSLIIHSGDPWIYTMGLVSTARERRPAYDAVRSQFRKEKYVALPMGTYSKDAPIFFVLAGLVVLVTVAYLYNASRRFRDNLTRSISNSYNFFSDIRDQHGVSVLHSTLLGLLVSVAFGIVVASILFHFRSSWILDDLLSYLLVFDNFKQTVVEIIWDPLSAILYASLVTFGLMVAEAIVILLVAPLLRSRMYLYHSYTIVMWSASPLIVLIPIGMILYRIMESPTYVAPAVVIPALLVFWSFLRAMKGIAIVSDNLRAKVYALGLLSAVVVCTACVVYLDHRESIVTYLTYLVNAATLS